MKEYSKYLLNLNDSIFKPNEYKGDYFVIDNYPCKKNFFEDKFNVVIDCKNYYQVTNGQGSEEKKIGTIYSSSLQSLLVFSSVSKKRPLFLKLGIETYKIIKVLFEYNNEVIKRPSSIDVVLISDKNDLFFVESKLFEPVYGSVDGKMKYTRGNQKGEIINPKVIGISYFKREEKNGYFKKLGLNFEDLDLMKINHPEEGFENKEQLKIDKYTIGILENNKYVYPEGIKQTLSHLIGITNFQNNKIQSNCSNELKEFNAKSIHFLTIVNDLPCFDGDKNVDDRVRDFKDHLKHVYEIIKKKENEVSSKRIIIHDPISYQKLYSMNSGKDSYFGDKDNIVKFYHLDGK